MVLIFVPENKRNGFWDKFVPLNKEVDRLMVSSCDYLHGVMKES